MISYFGDFAEDDTVLIPFNTFDSNDPSASVTITNLADADIMVHKDGSTTQIATDGASVAIDFDTITGNHLITIDTSVDAAYTTGSEYAVRIEGTTVDGATINAWVGAFSIERAGGALAVAKLIQTAVITNAAGTDIAADIIAVKAETATIVADTNELQTDDIPGAIAALPTAAENRAEMDSNSTQLAAIVADTNELQTDDVPGLIAALNDPTVAAIADAVWDEALSGHTTPGTTGRSLQVAGTILSETTATGTPTTTTIPLTAGSATDDFYNDMEIVILSGTYAGLSRMISDYTGATKLVTVDEAFPGAVSASDAVLIRTNHKHTKTQIAAAVWATTLAELAADPGATPSVDDAIMLLYMALRNQRDTTATSDEIHNNAGTPLLTATLSDDATTFSKSKYV